MTIADVRLLQPNDDLVARIRSLEFVVFDFDGVFTDNGVDVREDGSESVRCNRSDGIGLSALRALGLELLILSTEVNPVVQQRAKKLRVECINGCEDKEGTLEALLASRGHDWASVAFVGNDVNDAAVLGRVGLPVVVADAHPRVADLGLYRTVTPGGHGAVREFCDLVDHVRRPRER